MGEFTNTTGLRSPFLSRLLPVQQAGEVIKESDQYR